MKINETHILVVEDDPFQNQLITSMVQSLGGARVSQAGNGRQALEIISTSKDMPVGLVACDLKMPEMDGMEFLRHLGEMNNNVAVIILSALEGKLLDSVAKMARLYGIKLLGTVEKPVTMARLNELFSIHQHTGKKWAQPVDEERYSLEEVLDGIRNHQFEPHFQPKVNLKSGRLVGAEALARWNHPEHGMIPPSAFIPLLEQNNCIDALTFQMIDRTARACRTFHEGGHHLMLSVNLSLSSLSDATLADRITNLVRGHGIDPQFIVLEITETAAMTETAAALENLARLCMNGFSLSIDDYGTGYSSLQQLTRIAFSELKIDKSFVKDLTENDALQIVVKSSVDMAHQLQIKSVAEGIELRQDWQALEGMGCDIGQGYYIAKPMSEQDFHRFVAEYDSKKLNPDQAMAGQQAQLRILVVEDDSFTRQLVTHVLNELGFSNVRDVAHAEAALKLFEGNAFDLLISDLDMPGIHGLKLIQSIRSGKTLAKQDMRIIVLTALSQMDIIGASFALDINGFIVKPITPAVLDEKISKAMTERVRFRPPISYAMVKSDFSGLSEGGAQQSVPQVSASILRTESNALEKAHSSLEQVSLRGLRPGMVLKNDVYLSNGMLILPAGRVLSEPSINRLLDIESALKDKSFTVHAS